MSALESAGRGPFILALDQGTTSSRAIVFDAEGRSRAVAQQEFAQHYPGPGEVEHDPEEIWSSQLAVAREALAKGKLTAKDIAAIGVTNQRETTILWERDTGKPVANAVVWQSRVTAPICHRLKEKGIEATIRQKTGLLLDPYFSGTKIVHLFETIPGLRERAERGEVLFGTVDSFLLWRLTGGMVHATDVSNASRTLLFDIHRLAWDDELLQMFGVPRAMLPEVRSNSEVYGHTDPNLFGTPIPIAGLAGDQQAATFGQACFAPGSAKNTYGTGCFLVLNTGSKPIVSKHGLLSTVGWQVGKKVTYCLEGSVFIAGAVVQWLRDGLGVIATSSEVEKLAASVPDAGGVWFVPAFVGLGAPFWDSEARGMILGITRDTKAGHIARAAIDSMAYHTSDLLTAMQEDAPSPLKRLKVDGGAAVNNQLMQFQADLLGVEVERPVIAETTALGAAYLAGLAVGVWENQASIEKQWVLDRQFTPDLDEQDRQRKLKTWRRAVERCRHWASDD